MGNRSAKEEKKEEPKITCEEEIESNFWGVSSEEEKYNFELDEELSNEIHLLENYDFLPLSVLHELFLFLGVRDLMIVFSTCRLFHEVVNNSYFWRSYYTKHRECYYKRIETDEEVIEKIVTNNNNINWKRKFFEDLSFLNSESRNQYYYEKYFRHELVRKEGESAPKIEFDSLYKFSIDGFAGSGKSSLYNRMRNMEFGEELKSNYVHVEFFIKTLLLPSEVVKLQIWDPMDDAKFRWNHYKMRYKKAHGIIVCFALDSSKFLGDAKGIVEDIHCFAERDASVVICGCKNDITRKERKIFLSDIKSIFKESREIYGEESCLVDIKKQYCECSAKEGRNIFVALGLLLDFQERKREYYRVKKKQLEDTITSEN